MSLRCTAMQSYQPTAADTDVPRAHDGWSWFHAQTWSLKVAFARTSQMKPLRHFRRRTHAYGTQKQHTHTNKTTRACKSTSRPKTCAAKQLMTNYPTCASTTPIMGIAARNALPLIHTRAHPYKEACQNKWMNVESPIPLKKYDAWILYDCSFQNQTMVLWKQNVNHIKQ